MQRLGWWGRSGLVALVGTLLLFGSGQAAEIAPELYPIWERTDRPVRDGQVNRTWMWGPEGVTSVRYEAYADAPDGERLVQYFDKSRMEINDPNADPRNPWYVTNGLLAWELITGQLQTGDHSFEERSPAEVQVAGDIHPETPTYATFSAALERPAQPIGTVLTDSIDRSGRVTHEQSYAAYGVTASYDVEETGHAVASVFWEFMNMAGAVFVDGSLQSGSLFENPFYGVGLPITGAYWMHVPVGGEWRDVLAQCFERRCLTYTPSNPEGWQVEAGNIGQHYYDWRYGDSDAPTLPSDDDLGPPVPGRCEAPVQAVIDAVTDSLGNVNPNSWAKGTGGDWTGGADSSPTVEVGQRVAFNAVAASECGPVEYRVQHYLPEMGVEVIRDWSADSHFDYTFTDAESGTQVMFIVDVRDQDPRTRFERRDDYTYLTYTVR